MLFRSVNTASYCGYTEQYKGLQALYDKYQKHGLVVLGFPANDFGKQEPGSNAEVADFCERTYKVKFPMIEKTSVIADRPIRYTRHFSRQQESDRSGISTNFWLHAMA